MKGYRTSFAGMFQGGAGGMPAVTRIEIPLIQRDYAQGRESAEVEVIRSDFLQVLVEAIAGGPPTDLDFVYGEIDGGTLGPLDGQQRLTTLFLLHWYLAVRTGRLAETTAWLNFAYATRPTAELFCRQLVKPDHQPQCDFSTPSEWITDQAWYLYSWRHDPSIQSMLVMLDAIHARLLLPEFDLDAAWERLTDPVAPAISFHFLPIDDMPSGEELYIKMNSRGKPLTDFETFKARFERILAGALPQDQFDRIIHNLDGAWTDVLWPYHGGDFIVDDEFLRYLEFIIEICEWRGGGGEGGSLLDRAERVFAGAGVNSAHNLEFLAHCFDTWKTTNISSVFATHFDSAIDDREARANRVTLFESRNVNLFQECCRRYGQMNGKARLFSLADTLMLYAVLVHRQYDTVDVQTRLRILRNLTDRSDEVRENRMVDLLEGTERLIRDGALDEVKGFNPDRVLDEQRKREFLQSHPRLQSELYALEDHPLLRGRVFAFALEPATLPWQAEVFTSIAKKEHWPRLTAALLACGNYGFPIGERAYQYGTVDPDQELRWREVFTRYGRGRNGGISTALNSLLYEVHEHASGPARALEDIAEGFTRRRIETGLLDWRYYLVTYPAMREGATGIYFGEHLQQAGRWGYSMCMLRTGSITGSARYRDPYLLAAWRESGVDSAAREPWFSGYEHEPRWLRLDKSEAGIRCVNAGFELQAPLNPRDLETFMRVCADHGAVDGRFLPVVQSEHDGELVDSEDRVKKCAEFLRSLVAAGL